MSGRRCLSFSPAGSDRPSQGLPVHSGGPQEIQARPVRAHRRKIEKAGGKVIRHDIGLIDQLPNEIIPIVGCQPESTPLIKRWRHNKRNGSIGIVATAARLCHMALPRGENGGYYRWHLNSFQLQHPGRSRRPLESHAHGCTAMAKERTAYRHCRADTTYAKFHQCESWIADTIDALARVTDRQLVIRDKEQAAASDGLGWRSLPGYSRFYCCC
jgi:hypothetical protein